LPIIVFTDGAATGNPGPDGWGAIVVADDHHVTELGGGSPHTTNDKMELSVRGAGSCFHHGRRSGYCAATVLRVSMPAR
jgi:ribonuclease HI